jgi:SPP1 family predicted phage head-tail adaptor
MDAAGSLRHRVTILSSTAAPDGIGGAVRTPVVVGTVWAAVTPQKGAGNSEVNTAGGLRARTQILVTIRYPSFTVDHTMRVQWNNKTWVIQRIVQRDMITRWLDLTCLEGE